MAVRAQTSIEFLLILSAVVLIVLAGVMSLSEITKMQQSAYSTVQGGVENASAGLLSYLSNETFGTGFSPIPGGFGEYTNASLVSLEIVKSEPYFLYQPSIIQLTAWNNYPAPMKVPRLLIWIVNSSGGEIPLSTSEEDNVTIILSHTLTSTFVPSNSGVYNVTAVAQDDNGSVLVNPVTNESVIIKTNFSVLDARPPSAGVMKTFNIEKEVVGEKDSTYSEVFSLPQDAAIYSAVLEIIDSHLYKEDRAGAQASYHYSRISECYCPQGTSCSDLGVVSSSFYSQQGVIEIPEKSFITSMDISQNPVEGDMSVFVNGIANPVSMDVVKPGLNTISISIAPAHNGCPSPPPSSSYASDIATGDATLAITYYAPSTATADPSQVIGNFMVNGVDPDISTSAVMDISRYMRAGENTLQFSNMQGTFTYKLVVNYV
jgi:hypothetical protein